VSKKTKRQFSILLPEQLIDDLDRIVERETAMKRSTIIEIALTEYVRNKNNYELLQEKSK